MQGNRLLRGVGVLIIIVAIVYLLLAVGGALWIRDRGFGSGWGTGWTGWLTIPLAGGAIFAALMLLVFGLMLYFLAKIDNNIAEAERRRLAQAGRPKVEPAVAAAAVTTVNLPDARSVETPLVEAPAVAPLAAGAAAAAVTVAAVTDDSAEAVATPWGEEALAVPEVVAAPESLDAVVVEAVELSEAPADLVVEEGLVVEAPELPDVELPAAETVLPRIEIEEPASAAVVAAAAVELAEPELALPEASRGDLTFEVLELEVEAPPELEAVEIEVPRLEVPEIDVPQAALPTVAVGTVTVETIDADLAGIDMPDVAVDAPALDLSPADLDDLNVPPVLPEAVELPRMDVSAPEVELETEDMSGREIGPASAALAAGATAAVVGREPEPEPALEPVTLPAAETRLPEIEITEVAPEGASEGAPSGEVVAAEATLAAATGVPEREATSAAAPAEVNEVAELKAEVASLKEMLAQLAAQLLPAAAAGAAVSAATTPERKEEPAPAAEPVEPPAAVDSSTRLPGSNEVARIAAEVNAAAPRRPRTVAKPPAPAAPDPAAPAPVEPAALDLPAAETRLPEPTDLPAPVVLPSGEDNLEAIAGLGPIYAKRLRELGVTTFEQLAEAPYDVLHKVTRGNLERVIKEDWRGQARRLAKKE